MGILDRFFGPPTRDQFANLVMEGIRRAGETREVLYDSEQFTLRPADQDGTVANLANLYHEFCAADKDQRLQVVKNTVRGWFAASHELPDCFEDAQHDILPSLRSRSYIELTLLQMAVDGHTPPSWCHEVIAEHLALGLVYDLPGSMRTIGQDDLDGWDTTLYHALETARANLLQLGDQKFLASGQGLYISCTADNYDASRMLLLDRVRQLEVSGDHVCMIPNRDTLIVAGSEDAASLAAMAAVATEVLSKPRPISGLAFRLEGDDWAPWLPELAAPHYERFKELRLKSFGEDYNGQKDLLDARSQKQGVDLFVASFSSMQHKQSGRQQSFAVWSEGVETLLPETDVVFFFRPDAEKEGGRIIAEASWQAVQEVAGDLLEPQGMYPERHLAREFPTASQLEDLIK